MTDSSGRRHLLDLPASEWRTALAALQVEPYRGDQIARWVFHRSVFDFAGMTDLPAGLRADLTDRIDLSAPTVDRVYTSVDGSRRYLLEVAPGQLIEAVYMPYERRVTLCISSQVGCRFGCTFCKTGELGLLRSLSAGEIVGQVLRLREQMEDRRARLNVVFMGQGEPLDNLEGVRAAVVNLQDPKGLAMSWRRITVSTVGLPPALRSLADLGERRPRFAISLNATTDEVRSQLMPVNDKYPIAALLETLRGISWRPGERVTFEYVMLAGVNDRREDARRLAGMVHGLPAKVNLIPWNPVPTMAYQRPSPETVEEFRAVARSRGVDILVRYSRGTDIGAACGQLQAAAGSVAPLG